MEFNFNTKFGCFAMETNWTLEDEYKSQVIRKKMIKDKKIKLINPKLMKE